MPLVRRWVAQCDAVGCTAHLIHEPIPHGERPDYGEATNDAGWASRPGSSETYCFEHFPDTGEFA